MPSRQRMRCAYDTPARWKHVGEIGIRSESKPLLNAIFAYHPNGNCPALGEIDAPLDQRLGLPNHRCKIGSRAHYATQDPWPIRFAWA
jgi:hypothetical protein